MTSLLVLPGAFLRQHPRFLAILPRQLFSHPLLAVRVDPPKTRTSCSPISIGASGEWSTKTFASAMLIALYCGLLAFLTGLWERWRRTSFAVLRRLPLEVVTLGIGGGGISNLSLLSQSSAHCWIDLVATSSSDFDPVARLSAYLLCLKARLSLWEDSRCRAICSASRNVCCRPQAHLGQG